MAKPSIPTTPRTTRLLPSLSLWTGLDVWEVSVEVARAASILVESCTVAVMFSVWVSSGVSVWVGSNVPVDVGSGSGVVVEEGVRISPLSIFGVEVGCLRPVGVRVGAADGVDVGFVVRVVVTVPVRVAVGGTGVKLAVGVAVAAGLVGVEVTSP